MHANSSNLSTSALKTAIEPWVSARKSRIGDLGHQLGVALAEMPGSLGLECLEVRELLNSFTATVLGKDVSRIAKLHQTLSALLPLNQVYNFEHADRYAMVYADTPEFKSMAFQTQSLTYMVVLKAKTAYLDFDLQDQNAASENDLVKFETFSMDIRLCTQGPNSLDYARPALTSLQPILESSSSVKASEYFRYRDGRDRGYLVSLRPDIGGAQPTGPVFETADMGWYAAFSFLKGIWFDLTSHARLLEAGSQD